MGWLFALALGLQQGSGRAVLTALPPIALGHAASVLAVAAALAVAGLLVPPAALRVATAVVLLGFGLYKLRSYYRHPRWVGMRVGQRDLVVWSFLMATAHGAGLMLAPVLLGLDAAAAAASDPAGHHEHQALDAAASTLPLWLAALGLHSLAMLLTMALVAWVVYRKLGLAVLRRGWVNFDLIWAGALLVMGGSALVTAL